jgi:hypothetical protein
MGLARANEILALRAVSARAKRLAQAHHPIPT